MKAVVFHAVGDIRIDNVPEPQLQGPTDAIVRITVSAICGTDLHMVRGTLPGMKPGTILGHEAVGTVVEVGSAVTTIEPGASTARSSACAGLMASPETTGASSLLLGPGTAPG